MRQIIVNNEVAYESSIVPNYFITKTGKIYSIYVKGGQGKVNIHNPHELAYGYDKDGYKRVVLSYDGKKTYIKIHTLVVEQFIGHIEHPLVVNHIDGNIWNNNVNNLEIVTIKDNTVHAHVNGLTSTECCVEVEYNNKKMLFRSMADCCKSLPDISMHYLKQLKSGIILFSIIDFRKLEQNRISKIGAYYNGELYKTFDNMQSAGLFYGKSRGSVSAAINNSEYRKKINKYHITFPSVSTIENTASAGSE